MAFEKINVYGFTVNLHSQIDSGNHSGTGMNFAAATADEAMAVARAHFGADLVSLSGPVLQIADVIYEPTLEPVEPEPEPEPEAKADHKSKKSHG